MKLSNFTISVCNFNNNGKETEKKWYQNYLLIGQGMLAGETSNSMHVHM